MYMGPEAEVEDGMQRPLFAAQTPSYRFRSRSVTWSRQRLRVPSWCLLGCLRPIPIIRVPLRLYFSLSSSSDDEEGSLRRVGRNFPVGWGFGGEGDRWKSEWWWLCCLRVGNGGVAVER